MRTLSAGLAAHIAQSVTTLATLWKVTRADGTVYGFTDHDADLVLSGVTYKAATGFQRSAVRATLGFEPDNLEISGALAASAITTADIRAGLWDYAVIEVSFCNWADLTQGVGTLQKGKLGPIKNGRNGFVAELLGLAQHLNQQVGRVYTVACDADLGDSRCGINLLGSPSLTWAGVVTAVTSKRVFSAGALLLTNGYFNGGKLTWTSGNNNTLKMEVKTYLNAGGAFTLQLPMPFTVQVGDAFSASIGCDKTLATCKNTFGNAVNFRGYPAIPGIRRLMSGGL